MRLPLTVLLVATVLAMPATGFSQAEKVDVDYAIFPHQPAEAVLAVFVQLSRSDEASQAGPLRLRASERGGQGRDYETSARLGEREDGTWWGSFQLDLLPGYYLIEIFKEGGHVIARRDITVSGLTHGRNAVLSDIILASDIAGGAEGEASRRRAELDIEAKADLVFGRNDSLVHYYSEIYNVDLAAAGDTAYVARAYVSDATHDRPVGDSWLMEETRSTAATDVITGRIDIAELPSGSYRLIVRAERHDGQQLAVQEKRFFVFNPGVEPLAVSVQQEDAVLNAVVQSEEEVNLLLRRMRVIANPNEESRMRRLSNFEEKSSFIEEFWRVRENRSGSPRGGLVADFMQRVESVNTRYGTQRREGWETDRGAAVLKHGEPSHVEANRHNPDVSPYEIWHYTTIPGIGEAFMVFVDRFGFGDFELVHSTVPGERRNPNWQAEIQRRR